jgi:hypothetical protein
MKARKHYRIIKSLFDERPNYYVFYVEQRKLYFFWGKPTPDNILAHSTVWFEEGFIRQKTFHSIEDAESAIARAITYANRGGPVVVG